MGGEGEGNSKMGTTQEEHWYFPKKDKEISQDGRTVRRIMQVCVLMHMTFFCFELFLYDWVFSMMFTELFLGWLAYMCARLMNKSLIICYAICLAIHGTLGIVGII